MFVCVCNSLSCLELLLQYHSTICLFMVFIKAFIHVLIKVLECIHNCYFEIPFIASAKLVFLRAYCNGLLASGEAYCLRRSCLSVCIGNRASGVIIFEVFLGVNMWCCLH